MLNFRLVTATTAGTTAEILFVTPTRTTRAATATGKTQEVVSGVNTSPVHVLHASVAVVGGTRNE